MSTLNHRLIFKQNFSCISPRPCSPLCNCHTPRLSRHLRFPLRYSYKFKHKCILRIHLDSVCVCSGNKVAFFSGFTGLISTFFSKFFFKTWSHSTIYTFKNYFTKMFSVFSNKRCLNRHCKGFSILLSVLR